MLENSSEASCAKNRKQNFLSTLQAVDMLQIAK